MFFFKIRRKDPAVQTRNYLNEESNSDTTVLHANGSSAGSMYFTGSAMSDVGCVRTNNEDNYILGTHMNGASSDYSEFTVSKSDPAIRWHFAAVFDGMGGGDRGEDASRKTAQIFLEAIRQLTKEAAKPDVDNMVRASFLKANNMILALQQESNVFGTTGTVLCTDCKEFKIFHLGDSRAYLIRDGQLFQLTKDQTLAQMKIDAGLYNEAAPDAEADKHKLTEYIGRDWTRENLHPLESQWIPLQRTDCLLLCSDGLCDMCSDAEIGRILQSRGNADMHVRALIEEARRNGGDDNITCIIIAFS